MVAPSGRARGRQGRGWGPRGAGWRVASRASGAPACMAVDVRGARAYPPKRELTTKRGDRLSHPMGRERVVR